MKGISFQILLAIAFAFLAGNSVGQNTAVPSQFRIKSLNDLEVHSAKLDAVEVPNATVEIANYLGRRAVMLVNKAGVTASGNPANGETIAIVKGADFKNGTIEAEVVGLPRQGAQAGVRGFVGIAFHVGPNGSRYECISLRQTNGRADDQLRRNHTTQYSSYPDFPWHRLRDESSGMYESYVDVEAGAWSKIKIVVSGARAQLYVNGADQPCLIVNDLKLGDTRGSVAFWAGTDTQAYFSNLAINQTE